MNGGGPGSGIWKSTDGGETWTRLKGNGLPDGRSAASGSTSIGKRPNILYALIEGPTPTAGRGGRGAAPEPDEAPQAAGRPRRSGAAA